MKRMPTAGEVVRIKANGRRSEYVVIAAEMKVSEDRLRGDKYYASTFTSIKHADLGKPNPKVFVWTNGQTSSYIEGEDIDVFNDVELLGKYKKVTSVTSYSATKLTMCGE